jgi:hypothetical protein
MSDLLGLFALAEVFADIREQLRSRAASSALA